MSPLITLLWVRLLGENYSLLCSVRYFLYFLSRWHMDPPQHLFNSSLRRLLSVLCAIVLLSARAIHHWTSLTPATERIRRGISKRSLAVTARVVSKRRGSNSW